VEIRGLIEIAELEPDLTSNALLHEE